MTVTAFRISPSTELEHTKRMKPPYILLTNANFAAVNDQMFSMEAGDIVDSERIAALVRAYSPQTALEPISVGAAQAIERRLSPGRVWR
jgi:hypothetical protein